MKIEAVRMPMYILAYRSSHSWLEEEY